MSRVYNNMMASRFRICGTDWRYLVVINRQSWARFYTSGIHRVHPSCIGKAFMNHAMSGSFRTRMVSSKFLYQLDPKRHIYLNENASRYALKLADINVQNAHVASCREDAKKIAEKFFEKRKYDTVLVKPNVVSEDNSSSTLASGLSFEKHLCKSTEEVLRIVDNMLGYPVVTTESEDCGKIVDTVIMHEYVKVIMKFYVKISMDYKLLQPCLTLCKSAAKHIDTVHSNNKSELLVISIDPFAGLTKKLLDTACDFLCSGAQNDKFSALLQDSARTKIMLRLLKYELKKIYECFLSIDAIEVEISKFLLIDTALCIDAAQDAADKHVSAVEETIEDAVMDQFKFMCVKYNILIDDAAIFRQQDLFTVEYQDEGRTKLVQAYLADAKYFSGNGPIGLLVNDTGALLATSDMIQQQSQSLGAAITIKEYTDASNVAKVINILNTNSGLKVILINIFGGVITCRTIAKGIELFLNDHSLAMPIVIRFHGQDHDEALDDIRNFENVSVFLDWEKAVEAACVIASQSLED